MDMDIKAPNDDFWIEPVVCDDETTIKVANALQNSGFVLDSKFKIVHKESCISGLSMRSPIEGDLSPEELAIARCNPGIGLVSVATIQGTSMNGMMGKSYNLFNTGIGSQWYMARVINPFGLGTVYIPILTKIQLVNNKFSIVNITQAELPWTKF